MAGMLDFDLIKNRIDAALVFESSVRKSGVRKEALRPLHYLFLSGEEMPRGRAGQAYGGAMVPSTSARPGPLARQMPWQPPVV